MEILQWSVRTSELCLSKCTQLLYHTEIKAHISKKESFFVLKRGDVTEMNCLQTELNASFLQNHRLYLPEAERAHCASTRVI